MTKIDYGIKIHTQKDYKNSKTGWYHLEDTHEGLW